MPAEEDIRRGTAGLRNPSGGDDKKVLRPSQRKEMAKQVAGQGEIAVSRACRLFSISETCYRYRPRLSDNNARIADWLLRLTYANRAWGFGLCFLYLRNVKGMPYNHKRVYRIYRELELNLRIEPKHRVKRDKPDALVVPQEINEVM